MRIRRLGAVGQSLLVAFFPLIGGAMTLNSGCSSSKEPAQAEDGQGGNARGGASTAGTSGKNTGGGSAHGGGSSAGAGGAGSEELFDCDDRDIEGALEPEGGVADGVTWEGKVHLTRFTQLKNTLKIRPGTHIIVDADVSIETFGKVTIFAEGTSDAPIRFCGREAKPGYWGTFAIHDAVTSDSKLSYVLVADAGKKDAALSIEAPLTITDVVVRNSGSDGLHAASFNDDSENVSLVENKGNAAEVGTVDGVTNFPLGGEIRDNGADVIALGYDGYSQNVQMHDAGVPYLQLRSVHVTGGVTAFDAGVAYRFAADTTLEFGGALELQVNGTADSPVVFEGETSGPGKWAGITLLGSVKTTSKIHYLTIRDSGHVTPAFRTDSAVLLDHLTLDGNDVGAEIHRAGVAPDSSDLVITRGKRSPLWVDAAALHMLPSTGDVTGNATDEIVVEGSGRSGLGCSFDFVSGAGTIQNFGVPYRLKSCITAKDANLTIAPGTEFIMEAGTQFGIESSVFVAAGSATKPIKFAGDEAPPGGWWGVHVTSVKSGSKLDYVQIAGAGKDGPTHANLELEVQLSVQHSTFSDSSACGVAKKATDDSDYTKTNVFENNVGGSICTF